MDRRSAVLVVIVLAACADLSGYAGGGDTAPSSDAGADANDAAVPSPPLDSGGDGPLEGGSDCPGDGGPAAVRVGTTCIDATEVTNAMYADFVVAKAADTSGQPAACAWNTSYVPTYGWPPAEGERALPVAGVDWCDATMYCAWVGKRLCGKIGGGPLTRAQGNDPAFDAWYRVCSGGGVHSYPYGDGYDAAKCNGESGARRDAGSMPACTTLAAPHVLDLSGNVDEWQDLCEDGGVGDPAADVCRVKGGAFDDSPTVLSCTSTFEPRRDYKIAQIGFRCCSF